jgi:hypothetical protein
MPFSQPDKFVFLENNSHDDNMVNVAESERPVIVRLSEMMLWTMLGNRQFQGCFGLIGICRQFLL